MKLYRAVSVALVALTFGCGAQGKLTVENTPQGRIGVYATKIVDGTKAITDAVKALEAGKIVPTAEARLVVQKAVDIDKAAGTLGGLLETYSALQPGTAPATDALGKIQTELNRIGAIVSTILVPLSDGGARAQVGALVGTLNQTLLTLSVELAKGVKPPTEAALRLQGIQFAEATR